MPDWAEVIAIDEAALGQDQRELAEGAVQPVALAAQPQLVAVAEEPVGVGFVGGDLRRWWRAPPSPRAAAAVPARRRRSGTARPSLPGRGCGRGCPTSRGSVRGRRGPRWRRCRAVPAGADAGSRAGPRRCACGSVRRAARTRRCCTRGGSRPGSAAGWRGRSAPSPAARRDRTVRARRRRGRWTSTARGARSAARRTRWARPPTPRPRAAGRRSGRPAPAGPHRSRARSPRP